MTSCRSVFLVLMVGFVLICWPVTVGAEITTLKQSVDQALRYSPLLQARGFEKEAVGHDLKKARGGYFPTLDIEAGYGAGNHSDSITRLPDADPSDSDWYSRGDASLMLVQRLYDGGETSQNVSIQKALLTAVDYGITDSKQAVSLNAISAHLTVYLQKKLVAIAEKDLNIHQDILQALTEIEQAGAGNIADVTQTQARLARAQSVLIMSQGDLRRAVSNYERVVGVKPDEVAFADVPDTLPASLEEALELTKQNNPALLALDSKIDEADSRVALAKSNYKPKINLELSSRYHDQLEGDPSWQHTNDALLIMRWNLYRGGQDRQASRAAMSRKYEVVSTREDKLVELQEATAAAWATYRALRSQKEAYLKAIVSNEKTFEAYLKQFSVSRRSLIDVLNAEKEYFQSARQLVTVSANEVIAAYRILLLGGDMQIMDPVTIPDDPLDVDQLVQTIVFPAADQSVFPELRTSTGNTVKGPRSKLIGSVQKDPSLATPNFSVEVGPFMNKGVLSQAEEFLKANGLRTQQTIGAGPVEVTRLLEGVYSFNEAFKRLEDIQKTVDTAFVLPKGDQYAIYFASFFDNARAARYADALNKKQIQVSLVKAEILMQGTILIVEQIDRQAIEKVTAHMSKLGVTAKVVKP